MASTATATDAGATAAAVDDIAAFKAARNVRDSSVPSEYDWYGEKEPGSALTNRNEKQRWSPWTSVHCVDAGELPGMLSGMGVYLEALRNGDEVTATEMAKWLRNVFLWPSDATLSMYGMTVEMHVKFLRELFRIEFKRIAAADATRDELATALWCVLSSSVGRGIEFLGRLLCAPCVPVYPVDVMLGALMRKQWHDFSFEDAARKAEVAATMRMNYSRNPGLYLGKHEEAHLRKRLKQPRRGDKLLGGNRTAADTLLQALHGYIAVASRETYGVPVEAVHAYVVHFNRGAHDLLRDTLEETRKRTVRRGKRKRDASVSAAQQQTKKKKRVRFEKQKQDSDSDSDSGSGSDSDSDTSVDADASADNSEAEPRSSPSASASAEHGPSGVLETDAILSLETELGEAMKVLADKFNVAHGKVVVPLYSRIRELEAQLAEHEAALATATARPATAIAETMTEAAPPSSAETGTDAAVQTQTQPAAAGRGAPPVPETLRPLVKLAGDLIQKGNTQLLGCRAMTTKLLPLWEWLLKRVEAEEAAAAMPDLDEVAAEAVAGGAAELPLPAPRDVLRVSTSGSSVVKLRRGASSSSENADAGTTLYTLPLPDNVFSDLNLPGPNQTEIDARELYAHMFASLQEFRHTVVPLPHLCGPDSSAELVASCYAILYVIPSPPPGSEQELSVPGVGLAMSPVARDITLGSHGLASLPLLYKCGQLLRPATGDMSPSDRTGDCNYAAHFGRGSGGHFSVECGGHTLQGGDDEPTIMARMWTEPLPANQVCPHQDIGRSMDAAAQIMRMSVGELAPHVMLAVLKHGATHLELPPLTTVDDVAALEEAKLRLSQSASKDHATNMCRTLHATVRELAMYDDGMALS